MNLATPENEIEREYVFSVEITLIFISTRDHPNVAIKFPGPGCN